MIPGLEMSVWEEFVSPGNLGRALRRVEVNRGAPGVDGMTTEQLRSWMRERRAGVREAVDAGTYRPLPVQSTTKTWGPLSGHQRRHALDH
ncbi:hypothetical protein AB0H88_52330 [Nonomuraea sp. NPDC050680]|uniref:hypothetical protein n=1 Tax=Nonomuraea sp. NPDC050680 TaxID=3154630 RepID=UPI0033F7A8DA